MGPGLRAVSVIIETGAIGFSLPRLAGWNGFDLRLGLPASVSLFADVQHIMCRCGQTFGVDRVPHAAARLTSAGRALEQRHRSGMAALGVVPGCNGSIGLAVQLFARGLLHESEVVCRQGKIGIDILANASSGR